MWSRMLFVIFCISSLAGQSMNLVPLSLRSDPDSTTASFQGLFGPALCDASGSIYLRYVPKQGSALTGDVTKLTKSGQATEIPINAIPEIKGKIYLLAFAVGQDGDISELLRAENPGTKEDPAQVYFARFDTDGQMKSRVPLEVNMIPNLLLPLPSGDFFTAGIESPSADKAKPRAAIAGIFGPDGKLKRQVTTTSNVKPSEEDKKSGLVDPALQGGIARFADDGNIYLLLADTPPKLVVINPTGQIERQLVLQEPFPKGSATNMLASGGHVLVQFYREADTPKDAFAYVLYDGSTGAIVRGYQPDFMGSPACFDGGKSVTILTVKRSTGRIALGKAELD